MMANLLYLTLLLHKMNGEIKRGRLGKKMVTSPVEIFLESRTTASVQDKEIQVLQATLSPHCKYFIFRNISKKSQIQAFVKFFNTKDLNMKLS